MKGWDRHELDDMIETWEAMPKPWPLGLARTWLRHAERALRRGVAPWLPHDAPAQLRQVVAPGGRAGRLPGRDGLRTLTGLTGWACDQLLAQSAEWRDPFPVEEAVTSGRPTADQRPTSGRPAAGPSKNDASTDCDQRPTNGRPTADQRPTSGLARDPDPTPARATYSARVPQGTGSQVTDQPPTPSPTPGAAPQTPGGLAQDGLRVDPATPSPAQEPLQSPSVGPARGVAAPPTGRRRRRGVNLAVLPAGEVPFASTEEGGPEPVILPDGREIPGDLPALLGGNQRAVSGLLNAGIESTRALLRLTFDQLGKSRGGFGMASGVQEALQKHQPGVKLGCLAGVEPRDRSPPRSFGPRMDEVLQRLQERMEQPQGEDT